MSKKPSRGSIHPLPPPLYHGGGMNLLVRPRVYIKIIWLKWKCWNISSVGGVNEVPGRLPTSNNNLVGCYGKNPFRRDWVTKMKRPGDELNFNEEEQGGKSRKTLNFTRADRDASPSSSNGDVAGPETAKDKCTGKLAPRNFSRKFSWWDTRSYSLESPDETATPGRVLVLYSFEKKHLRQEDRTIPACSTCCQCWWLLEFTMSSTV